MSVLVVTDEAGIRQLVCERLQDQGLDVDVAGTVAEATAALAPGTFGVVIVDLALPDGSGLHVLAALRASGSTAHVIVLSGSTAEADHVQALHRGADDVVVTPFSVRELTARVLAVRRRRDAGAIGIVRVGRFAIDVRARRVTSGGREVGLTAKEFDLLAYLAARPGHVFSRDHLLKTVWHSDSEWQQEATVTEHVRRLRRKLESDPGHPRFLCTVRGAGYRIDQPAGAPAAVPRAAPARATIGPVETVIAGPLTTACERAELEAVADLLRGLLRVHSASGAADLLQRAVLAMGGNLVPVDGAGVDALPIDVSLGEGPPVLVEVSRRTAARARLERLLPRLVEDARHAVDRLGGSDPTPPRHPLVRSAPWPTPGQG